MFLFMDIITTEKINIQNHLDGNLVNLVINENRI